MRVKIFKPLGLPQTLCRILWVMFFTSCLIPGMVSAQKMVGLYDDLFSVSFPNEKDGWACGRWGRILHTTDGGKTWTHQNSGTEHTLTSITFLDPRNGWAVGDGGTIVYTGDGGKTWEKQQSPVPFYLMKVFFLSPLRGLIVTERTTILLTEDGGKTWQKQFSDQDFILKSLSFADPLNGWAVGEYGYIYRTRNGGATWEKQAGFYKLSDRTGEIEGGTYLFDVVAIDPHTAWAVGIDGYVIKTTDGGKTWKEIDTGAPKTQLFCVTSDNRDTILISGKGTFLSSADKGKTWQTPEFKPPIIYGWIYGLTPRGRSGFVAVGSEGVIYLSTSSSWERIGY